MSESDDGIYELNIKMTITDNFDGDITNTEQVVSNIEEYDDCKLLIAINNITNLINEHFGLDE